VQKKFEYIGAGRVLLNYELPLNEIVLDFYDRLKSASRGYASLDYPWRPPRVADGELDVLVAGIRWMPQPDRAPQFATTQGTHRALRNHPRQMFEVALQAAIGSKIVSRNHSGDPQERAR
jgi:GTP-binding protein LepA